MGELYQMASSRNSMSQQKLKETNPCCLHFLKSSWETKLYHEIWRKSSILYFLFFRIQSVIEGFIPNTIHGLLVWQVFSILCFSFPQLINNHHNKSTLTTYLLALHPQGKSLRLLTTLSGSENFIWQFYYYNN